jgi:transglutaminase-like putative cysteine protease
MVAGEERNAIKVAQLLNTWVYENVTKKPTLTIPSALDVLKSKEGDCNEHTILYVALARALGLPARVAVGVVYFNGAFYYHAWPEVWLGEEVGWIPTDPTFGMFPADASRIRLAMGSLQNQMAVARFMGKLKIEVLAY